jgi:hypothetical protein
LENGKTYIPSAGGALSEEVLSDASNFVGESNAKSKFVAATQIETVIWSPLRMIASVVRIA